jgi:hypothetical protein
MSEKLTEAAIRNALLCSLRNASESVILEEVKIEGGAARIDVVSFGDEIVGYEIKSDFDNFDRMPNQIHAYNRVFPKINLVCGQRHLDYALAVLPSWWGIIQLAVVDGQPQLQQVREAKSHDRQDPYSVASLLSKRDAVELLSAYRCSVRPRSNLRAIWEAMAKSVPLRKIEDAIVQKLSGSSTDMMMPLFDGG